MKINIHRTNLSYRDEFKKCSSEYVRNVFKNLNDRDWIKYIEVNKSDNTDSFTITMLLNGNIDSKNLESEVRKIVSEHSDFTFISIESVDNYYKLLELSDKATEEVIKTAFRKMAMKMHPDKNLGVDTTALMQELIAAYETLVDQEKREEYDKLFKAERVQQPKRRKTDDYVNQEPRSSHKNNFFSGQTTTKFKDGDWTGEYNSYHLFVYHPKIRGSKNNITFWSISSRPFISLPINYDRDLRQRIRLQLIPIIPFCEYWPVENDVELMIKLPQEKNNCAKILDFIFVEYQLPESFIEFIKEKMGLYAVVPSRNRSAHSERHTQGPL